MVKINIDKNMTFILEVKIMAIRWLCVPPPYMKKMFKKTNDIKKQSEKEKRNSNNENGERKDLLLFLPFASLFVRTMSRICPLAATECVL